MQHAKAAAKKAYGLCFIQTIEFPLLMDTQFLESFVVVVEHGSVAEAARRLNLTPAAVTQRIRALEHEIGALLRDVRDLRAIATEQTFSGELKLGAVASALTGILPSTLARVTRKYPQMKLTIDPGISPELYKKVVDGELDAAVIVEPQFALPKTCEWTTWREEPLVVLAPRAMTEPDPHRLLSTEPFIRYDRRQWGGLLADTYLRRAGIYPTDRYELDSLDAIAVLVDRGLGVSLVLDWAAPWPEGLSLRKISLPEPFEMRRIGLLWRRASPRIRLLNALMTEAAGS